MKRKQKQGKETKILDGKNDSEVNEEAEQICQKCGNIMIEEEGKLVCPHCQGEIDFFGDNE